jgi:hypothetical protein
MIVSMKPQLADDFEWIAVNGERALICRALARHARHVFTTRGWALGSAAGADEGEAWSAVAAAVDVPASRLVRLRQVHGASVVVKRREDSSGDGRRAEADIIVSDDPESAVAIQTADCVPLLMADAVTGAVGAAHAGWRGLAAGVPGAAVGAMASEFGVRPADLVVAAGPSISAARYEVGGDVRSTFETAFGPREIARWFPAETRPLHWEFDGWSATRDQLIAAGVPPASIHVSGICTACYPDLLCSYRREGKWAGRMAAVIRAGRGSRSRA